MLDIKHIIKLLSLHPKRTTLNILNFGIVDDKGLNITDLDFDLIIHDTGLPIDTIVDILDYKKTKNIISSISTDYDKEEFPWKRELGTSDILPNDLFNDVSTFTNYTSNDYTTRQSLTGVFYDLENGEICATYGHILHKKIINKSIKKNFILPRIYTNVIQYINDKIGINNIVLWENGKIDYELEHTIEIQFNGGVIYFRCCVGIYPEYNSIIPEINEEKIVDISIGNKNSLLKVVRTLEKYTDYTGEIDFFDTNIALCKKDDKEVYMKMEFNPFASKKLLSFNDEYLKQILNDIKTNIKFYSNGTNCGANIFFDDVHTYVIMPLRCDRYNDEEVNGEYDFDGYLDGAIEIKAEPIKIKKKKNLTSKQIIDLLCRYRTKSGEEILNMIEKLK